MTAVLAEMPARTRAEVAWQDRARCTEMNPELFFPERGVNGSRVEQARQVCEACEVQADCLAYALRHHLDGIWGGTSEHERRDLRKAAGLPGEELPKLPKSDDPRVAPCGTAAGARRHYRRGEPLDEACRLANNRERADRPDRRQRCPECRYRLTSANHRAICGRQA